MHEFHLGFLFIAVIDPYLLFKIILVCLLFMVYVVLNPLFLKYSCAFMEQYDLTYNCTSQVVCHRIVAALSINLPLHLPRY